MRDILFARLHRFGILAEIIIPLGESQTALIGLADHHVGILEILAGAEIEKDIHSHLLQASYLGRKIHRTRDVRDAIEFGLEGRQTFGLDGFLVHARRIVIADFLRIGIAAGWLLSPPAQESAAG